MSPCCINYCFENSPPPVKSPVKIVNSQFEAMQPWLRSCFYSCDTFRNRQTIASFTLEVDDSATNFSQQAYGFVAIIMPQRSLHAKYPSRRLIAPPLEERQQHHAHGVTARVSRARERGCAWARSADVVDCGTRSC